MIVSSSIRHCYCIRNYPIIGSASSTWLAWYLVPLLVIHICYVISLSKFASFWFWFYCCTCVCSLLHGNQYGLDTSEFTYNPSEPHRFQPVSAQPTEERSRCTIMWWLNGSCQVGFCMPFSWTRVWVLIEFVYNKHPSGFIYHSLSAYWYLLKINAFSVYALWFLNIQKQLLFLLLFLWLVSGNWFDPLIRDSSNEPLSSRMPSLCSIIPSMFGCYLRTIKRLRKLSSFIGLKPLGQHCFLSTSVLL
jgi:hypothetical protein